MKEIFIQLVEIEEIVVQSDWEFTIYCSDGDIFYGHSIIVHGNINGEFNYAKMAG